MVTYVEEKEGLQARAEGTTGRRKAKKAKLKRVGFGTLEVRLYPITLGDNPACTRGPPVRNCSFFSDCLLHAGD
jgi:hypothetical protein